MSKKIGRNDPCPCGSGKKHKNCCMLKEKEGAAKFTPSGKRKFKATHIKMEDKSMEVFSRSAAQPKEAAPSDALEKLKFRMSKEDFRKKAEEKKLPFKITPSEKKPTPLKEKEHKPGDTFEISETDFRTEEE